MTTASPSSEQTNDPLIGRLIDGRYQVRSRIARGGMATVYLATDLRLERRVAIKIMHAHLADDTAFAQRFIQEARSAARLAHPNVVNVFDQGEDGETAYIVMEYLPGITLRELLKEYRRLTPEQALDILESVLAGLAAAHRAGIVHRDLKPENVMLADDGRIKLADFGLARAATANTATGQALLGTIAYLSPELVSRGVADARSDIYALGIMLYEMLTGVQPYVGDAPMQIAYQHANSTVPLPSEAVPGTPSGFDELVRWTTERDPEQRPRDAQALLDRLRSMEADIRAGGSATTVLPRVSASDEQRTQVLSAPTAATVAFMAASGSAGIAPTSSSEVLTQHAARRERRARWLLLIVVIAALFSAGAGWYQGHGPGSYLAIPDVAGQSLEAATAALQAAGFQVTSESAYNPDVAAGLVFGTKPDSSSRAPRNAVITMLVSLGAQMLPFPNIEGATEDVARDTLKQFTVAEKSLTEFSATIPNGHVVRAVDASGGTISGSYPEKGSVTLVVSLGPLPDVVGKTLEEASALLEAAGLQVTTGAEEFSDTIPAGSVISATPASDPIGPGGTVELVVSKGQDLVMVPDVRGMTMKKAIKVLSDAGFKVSYNTNYFPNDSILQIAQATSTNPAGGTQAKRGSEVYVSGTIGG
ncbi:MAG: Stk1 family PASTA domain-containing Ser/Thr kinase [Agromyces sp.]